MVKLAYEKLLTLHFIHLTHRLPFNISKEMESTIIKMFERLTIASTFSFLNRNIDKSLEKVIQSLDCGELNRDRM